MKAGPVASPPPAGAPAPSAADPREPLVQVRDLVKQFPITRGIVMQRKIGAVRAVDGVSFDVRRGETLGIVGETGSSATISFGFSASVLATPMRWRWPPENSCG